MVRSRTADVYYKAGNQNEEGLDRMVYWARMLVLSLFSGTGETFSVSPAVLVKFVFGIF